MTPPVSNLSNPAGHAYTQLTSALHPSNSEGSTILEIDILPSSHCPQLLYEHPALALPKALLVQLYLTARRLLFAHLASPREETYDAALQATSVVLLWDPNYLTAANFRKRHIQSLSTRWVENGYGERDGRRLRDAVQRELRFLDSLVTSPLNKHAKASTLWGQRLWIMQNFWAQVLLEDGCSVEGDTPKKAMIKRIMSHWDCELHVIMKAGERHPRNYYAWQYARQLFWLPQMKEISVESFGQVHQWCLMHPRDVSGWGFLVFLMASEETVDGDSDGRRIARETTEWVRKYEWEGESVEWFLKAVGQLQLD